MGNVNIEEPASAGAAVDPRALADQILAFAVTLAMENAVQQQQQQYVLRNAITAAAAAALIRSSPADALALAREALSGKDLVDTLAGLRGLLDAHPAAKGGVGT